MRLLVVLSGPIAAGKSSFGEEIVKLSSALRVSTRKFIQASTGASDDRGALQAAGDQLDIETGGTWVADAVAERERQEAPDAVLLLDSARIVPQVAALRARWGDKVFHVHLHAEDEVLSRRYLRRPPHLKEFATYEEVRMNATEASVGALREIADLVLDTDYVRPETLAATAMDWREGPGVRERAALVDVIVGGQYGSEGKGNVCAHLAKH